MTSASPVPAAAALHPPEAATVFVVVGTDMHPFDRLMDWMDGWLGSAGGRGVRCLVQSGSSRPPRLARHSRLLPYDEVLAAMRAATAVVCHGGPGTIMDCRDNGRLPIVVPRQHRFGEHVDDHQLAFANAVARHGQVLLGRTADELGALLDRALADPASVRIPPAPSSGGEGVARFRSAVAALGPRPARRPATGRRGRTSVLRPPGQR